MNKQNALDIKILSDEVHRLTEENTKLKAQLPEGMEHCTIIFKECEMGHGWLTATNWIQHGCLVCELNDKKGVTAMEDLTSPDRNEQERTADSRCLYFDGETVKKIIIKPGFVEVFFNNKTSLRLRARINIGGQGIYPVLDFNIAIWNEIPLKAPKIEPL
jgi:hypothetical protein